MNAVKQAAENDPVAAEVSRNLQAAAKAAAKKDGRPVSTQKFLVRHALDRECAGADV